MMPALELTPPPPSPGLTSAEARSRLARVGPNALPRRTTEPAWRAFLRQFQSPLIYVLLAALLIDVAVWVARGARAVPLESAAIAVILLLNAGLGTWHERKAEHALRALADLAAPCVWTLRDGAFTRVLGAELVPGDVVRLEAGDRVPADGLVPGGGTLMVDDWPPASSSSPIRRATGTCIRHGTSYCTRPSC